MSQGASGGNVKAHPTLECPERTVAMAKRARKGRARKKKKANHGKRPNAR